MEFRHPCCCREFYLTLRLGMTLIVGYGVVLLGQGVMPPLT